MPFKTVLDFLKEPPQPVIKRKINIEQPSQQEKEAFLGLFNMNPSKISNNKRVDTNIMDQPKECKMDSFKEDKIYVYTDGSCILNGKPNARGGWGVYFPNGEFPDKSARFLNSPTNQRCELWAIWEALNLVKDQEKRVELYTDSEYSLKCLQEYCKKWSINGWKKADNKPIENRDIIEPLYGIYAKNWRYIQLNHVRAHTGNSDEHSKNNDMADKLARNGALKN